MYIHVDVHVHVHVSHGSMLLGYYNIIGYVILTLNN